MHRERQTMVQLTQLELNLSTTKKFGTNAMMVTNWKEVNLEDAMKIERGASYQFVKVSLMLMKLYVLMIERHYKGIITERRAFIDSNCKLN